MNLITLSQDEPWMTPEERDLNRNFNQATTELLAARGVPVTPLIMLRVNDVIATWLLARRLESALAPKPGKPAPCPTPAQAGAIGKCRDRLRRAMKDLEACCARDAVPTGPDLPERMQHAAQPHAEPAHPNENVENAPPNAEETDAEPPQDPVPAENTPTAQSTGGHPETRPMNHTPISAEAAPIQPPKPAATPSRKRRTAKKRRKKRGRPIRPSPS